GGAENPEIKEARRHLATLGYALELLIIPSDKMEDWQVLDITDNVCWLNKKVLENAESAIRYCLLAHILHQTKQTRGSEEFEMSLIEELLKKSEQLAEV